MNQLVLADKAAEWRRLKALVLDSVSSPVTRRVYNLGLDEFFPWYGQEVRPGFSKATAAAWRVALEARGLGSISINVRITAMRKLAVEAADNGLLAPEIAAGITRIKGVACKGVRLGNWLSVKQAQALLNAPDVATNKGLRDRAILAVLLGCGLRRSEVAALTVGHVQQRDGRWCVVDLVGKHGRVRTVPMPTWVLVAVDAWTSAVGVVDGKVFRAVHRGDQAPLSAKRLSGNSSRDMRQRPASPALRRTTCGGRALSCAEPLAASLSRSSCSWATHRCRRPERYLGTKQDLVWSENWTCLRLLALPLAPQPGVTQRNVA
jgi:site-specific recombinase XerC